MNAENSAANTTGSDAMAGKNGNKKYNPSTIALLKEFIANHKKVHFAAAAGRWKPNKLW